MILYIHTTYGKKNHSKLSGLVSNIKAILHSVLQKVTGAVNLDDKKLQPIEVQPDTEANRLVLLDAFTKLQRVKKEPHRFWSLYQCLLHKDTSNISLEETSYEISTTASLDNTNNSKSNTLNAQNEMAVLDIQLRTSAFELINALIGSVRDLPRRFLIRHEFIQLGLLVINQFIYNNNIKNDI